MSHTKRIFGPPACIPNNGGRVSCRILLFCSALLLGPPLLFFQDGYAKSGKSKGSEEELMHANKTAFEGGRTGTAEDTGASINSKNFRRQGGKYDIPTGSKPSPLFGAKPFTQQMLRFEEFGSLSLPEPEDETPGKPFPAPPDTRSGPQGNALDGVQATFPMSLWSPNMESRSASSITSVIICTLGLAMLLMVTVYRPSPKLSHNLKNNSKATTTGGLNEGLADE